MYALVSTILALGVLSGSSFVKEECNSHCKLCSISKLCVECDYGFYLHDGECVPCSLGNFECKFCSQDAKLCYKCEPGFYLASNDLCDVCWNGPVRNCEICSPDGKECAKCIENYELAGNECVPSTFSHPICKYGEYNANGSCRDCKFANNWCELCSYDGSKCFLCESGFFLTQNGLCDICHNGPVVNCEHCSSDGKTCFDCIPGYTLFYNRCVPYQEYATSHKGHI